MSRDFFMLKKMMKQDMNSYSANDLWVWQTLAERQLENIPGKAADAYICALDKMKPVLNTREIPNFQRVNDWFTTSTGWKIEVVPGLIEVEEFFQLLASKTFCSSTWLRSKDSLDYLEEPDMFHDVFGHIPLLCDPVFSEFVHEFGKLGCAYLDDKEKLVQLQRLYWFTIEFGVIRESGKIKSYGAGILSSFGETNQIEAGSARFHDYDLEQVIHRPFRTDVMQEDYFVVESFEQLYQSIRELNRLWSPAKKVA